MVRQIALGYLSSRSGTGLVPEPASVALVVAFMLAQSQGRGKRISVLAPVSIPHWLVQVSPTESVLLSGVTDRTQDIEVTDNTALGAVRKMLTSETRDAKSIPQVVEGVLAALASVERKKYGVKYIQRGELLARVGRWMQEVGPAAKPPRLNLVLDSQGALSISEQFKQLKSAAEMRLATMEEIRTLARGRVMTLSDTLASAVKREGERRKKQSQSLEEIEQLETSQISDKTQSILYSLEEKHKMQMRALTAEFVRTSSSLEQFFAQILESIRQSRVEIGKKAENITGAIEEFKSLESLLDQNVPKYREPMRLLDEKAQDLLNRARQLTEGLEDQKASATESLDAQIREHRHRIIDFELEGHQSQNESEELLQRIETSIARLEVAFEQRTKELESDLRRVSTFTFESSLVEGIAPLTLLDISMYAAVYQSGDLQLFSPTILPPNRFGIPLTEVPLEPDLDRYLLGMISNLAEANAAFLSDLKTALNLHNLLGDAKARQELADGLQQLQARQLLKEGVAEAVLAAWNKYAGR